MQDEDPNFEVPYFLPGFDKTVLIHHTVVEILQREHTSYFEKKAN